MNQGTAALSALSMNQGPALDVGIASPHTAASGKDMHGDHAEMEQKSTDLCVQSGASLKANASPAPTKTATPVAHERTNELAWR